MKTRRVVVTGVAGVSPIGVAWDSVRTRLLAGEGGVQLIDEWRHVKGLRSHLGAPADFETPLRWPRKMRRAMGRVSAMAVRATELALEQAGLRDDPALRSGRAGVAYGSSSGSSDSLREVGRFLATGSTEGVSSNVYVKLMPHTAAAAIGMFFGLTGRLLPSSSACTSGSLSLGMAYETIRHGYQDVMVAGGSDELDLPAVATFDTLYATSRRNEAPSRTPRPFDADRDGLVVGEGAGTFVLESRRHALKRGAEVLAELVGFGANSDGNHPTQPQQRTMAEAMRLALADANLSADEIAYVNAHGTATDLGDIAESRATSEVFGRPVPISSLKSYIGHTLGACGSLEAWMSLNMLREGWATPTINLEQPDPRCAALGYVVGEPRRIDAEHFMTNNFAFGGVNTSLIFRLPQQEGSSLREPDA